MRIAVVGSGYVGLVSGACLADFGHNVHCVDLSDQKIAALQRGEMPIFEPGLAALVQAGRENSRLIFSTDVAAAVRDADLVFIAVGTPSRRGDGHADLSFVYSAARTIAEAMSGFTVVVTKSTVPVGTGDEVERIIRETRPDADFAVASNPEFLREGAAIEDFKHPDRIVIGTDDERARVMLTEVYRPLLLGQSPLLFVSRRTSELIKYASNAFLAMKLTFINEMADLCEALDANVQDVARGIGLDSRIGPKYLNAGPGYGGSCLPKDTLALIKTARDHGSPVQLVETTVTINESRKNAMADKIIAACGGSVAGKTIGVLGLTFAPNTDDLREAPSLPIIKALQHHGALVRAYDPEGMGAAAHILEGVTFGADAYEIAIGADALVIVTEWNAFRSLDFARLGAVMADKLLVDLRNIYSHLDVETQGFRYVSVGRPAGVMPGYLANAAE